MKNILRIALFAALLVTLLNMSQHCSAIPGGKAPSYSRPTKEVSSWWR